MAALRGGGLAKGEPSLEIWLESINQLWVKCAAWITNDVGWSDRGRRGKCRKVDNGLWDMPGQPTASQLVGVFSLVGALALEQGWTSRVWGKAGTRSVLSHFNSAWKRIIKSPDYGHSSLRYPTAEEKDHGTGSVTSRPKF